MKRPIFIALLLSSMSLHAVTATNAWKLKNNFTVSKVWQHTGDSSLYVSIEKTKIDDMAQFKNILNNKADLAKFEQDKKATLALIGVKNWTAPTKEWANINGREFLRVQGTYIDNSDETVYFREYHLVENGNVLQILFTSTNKDAYQAQNDIEYFLKDVKMDVISE